MNRLTRLAVLPAATLVFGSLLSLAAPAAHASSCNSGPTFTLSTTGTTADGSDRWNTESYGRTTLRIETPDDDIDFDVKAENCTTLCAWVYDECTVDYVGTLSIWVKNGGGAYTLYAMPSGPPPVTAPQPGDCNIVNTGAVCAGITTGDLVDRVSVVSVELGSSEADRVVGSIDRYRYPLPTGGSVVLPCVTLAVIDVDGGTCTVAGGTYDSTVAVLVDQSVPTIGEPLVSVGICEAEFTVKVAGFGLEQFPAYSVC